MGVVDRFSSAVRAAASALLAPSPAPVTPPAQASSDAAEPGGLPSRVASAVRASADHAWLATAQLRNRLRGSAASVDPRQANTWEDRRPYDDERRKAMARNGLARRAISLRVLDALRPGWALDLPKPAGGDSDPKLEARQVEAYGRRLRFRQKLKRALVWSEQDGHAIIVMGIDDGQDFALPLSDEPLTTVRWLKAIPAPRYQIGDLSDGTDGREPGLPVWYEIEDLTEPEVEAFKLNSAGVTRAVTRTRVHWSRVLGPFHTEDGHSRLDEIGEALEDYFSTQDAAERLAATMSVGHHEIAGWNARTAQDEVAAHGRIREAAEGLSLTNNLITDMTEEKFSYVNRSATGMDGIIDRKQVQLGGFTGLPGMVFFGLDPAGFSSGKEVMEGYYDSVRETFEDRVEPEVRRFVTIVRRCKDLGQALADEIGIRMNPLREPTSAETLDMKVKAWKAAIELVNGPLLDRDEARRSLFGVGANDITPTIELNKEETLDKTPAQLEVGVVTAIVQAALEAAKGGLAPDTTRALVQLFAPQTTEALLMRIAPDDPSGTVDAPDPASAGDGLVDGEAPALPAADRWVTAEEVAAEFGSITGGQLKKRRASTPGLAVQEVDAKGPRLRWVKPGRAPLYRLSEVRTAFEGGGADLDPATPDQLAAPPADAPPADAPASDLP